jgi:DNA-directed RNA polymerase subunit beta'
MRRPGRDNVPTVPIKSNFLCGHNEKEYLISAHGARAGLVDKGLITAHSGHLLRNWIYLLQHLLIVQEDCKTSLGLNADIFIKDQHQILGTRYDVAGVLISKVENGLIFRSPWSCMAKDKKGHSGVCQKCYGKDPATGKLPDIGLPVGILAAQALGERISQETLKSFHSGGTEQEGKKGLALVTYVGSAFKIESKDAAIVSEKLNEIMSHFSPNTRPGLIHYELVLRGYQKDKHNSDFLSNLCHSQAISILRDIAFNNSTDDIRDVIGRIVTGQLIYTGPRRKIDD